MPAIPAHTTWTERATERLPVVVGIALTVGIVALFAEYQRHAGPLWRDEVNSVNLAHLPSLYEVYSPPSTSNTGNFYNDPVLCPGGTADTSIGGNQLRDCDTQFDLQSSGNRNLDAETSTAWSLGLVLQPTPSSTLSVDYWNYTIKNSIGTYGEEVLFSDPTKYANNFVRCSQLTQAQANAINGAYASDLWKSLAKNARTNSAIKTALGTLH